MNTLLIKRSLKIVAAVLVVSALTFAFLPQAQLVDIEVVKQQNLEVVIEGEGKTRVHDLYTISTPIEGRVTRIESEPGDRVVAGETVIANMYPANPQFLDKRLETQAKADLEGARAALALANARVKQAKAQLEYDESDFNRTRELYEKKMVSQAHLESAELRIKTLRAELETALSNLDVMQSRLDAAKARLLQPEAQVRAGDKNQCQICIYSPVDGQLLRVLHKSESVVPMGTPLVEVGDTQDLEVQIELLSTEAVKVSVGDQALIKRWGGEQEIKAEVKLIEPAGFTKVSSLGIEEQRVNVLLRFTDEQRLWQSLGHAFRVEAAISVDSVQQAKTVPLSALFRHNEHWSVFKVVDGVAKLTEVSLGKRNDLIAEVLSGLELDEQVILYPGNAIDDGVKVKAR